MTELEEIDRIFKEVQMAHTIAEHQNSLLYTSPAIAAMPPATNNIATPHMGLNTGSNGIAPPNPALMLHLIQQYPDLQAKIDELAQRFPNVDTDFNTNDFPTEVSDRLAVISRCDKYAKAISLKDEMLWIALSEKEKVEQQLQKEMVINKEYCEEINKWASSLQDHVNKLESTKQEKERLRKENVKLKELLRKHNIYYNDMSNAPPLPPPPTAPTYA